MSLKNFADKTKSKAGSKTFQGFSLSTITEKTNKISTSGEEEKKQKQRVRVRKK